MGLTLRAQCIAVSALGVSVVAAAATAGCGRSPLDDARDLGAGAAGPSDTSAPGSSTPGGPAATSPEPVAPSPSTGSSSSSAPAPPTGIDIPGETCPFTQGLVAIGLRYDLTTYSCNSTLGAISFPAVVVPPSSPYSLELVELSPSCLPNGSPCMQTHSATLSAFPYDASKLVPGLSFEPIPFGAFVNVEADFEGPGCAQRFLVTNLPSFAGMPNPVSTQPFTWFAAADGTIETFPDAEFTITRSPDCVSPQLTAWRLDFVSASVGPLPIEITVPVGATYDGSVGNEHWRVKNLKSYDDGTLWSDLHATAYWLQQVFDGGGDIH